MCKIKKSSRWPINRLGDLKKHLAGPCGDTRPFHRMIYDISKKEYCKMCTANSVNGPLNIDRTSQPFFTGGLLGDQMFRLFRILVMTFDGQGNLQNPTWFPNSRDDNHPFPMLYIASQNGRTGTNDICRWEPGRDFVALQCILFKWSIVGLYYQSWSVRGDESAE